MTRLSLALRLSLASRLWLTALLLLSAIGFFVVPSEAEVPIHWNLQGQPDAYAAGWIALLIPLSFAALSLLVLVGIRALGSEKSIEAATHPYDTTTSAVLAFFVTFQGAMIYLGQGGQVRMQSLLVAAAGMVLIVVGNALPKTKPSWQAGLPLRWTKNDPDAWRITQRWFARAHLLAGVVLLSLAALDVRGPLLITMVLVAAFSPTLVAVIVARRLSNIPAPQSNRSGHV